MTSFPVVTGRIEYDSDSMQVVGPHFPHSTRLILWDNALGAPVTGNLMFDLFYGRCGKWMQYFVENFTYDTSLVASALANLALRTVNSEPQLAPVGGGYGANGGGKITSGVANIHYGAGADEHVAVTTVCETTNHIRFNFEAWINGVGTVVFPGAPSAAGIASIRNFTGRYPVVA